MTCDVVYTISGGGPIVGEIKCMGAKNLATKAMIASILADGKTYLHNVPNIGDVEITEHMLTAVGVKIKRLDDGVVEIDPSTLFSSAVTLPDSRTNRIPILLLSILLHKFGHACVPIMGGDEIGKRNVNFHVEAIEKFGAKVLYDGKQYTAHTEFGLEGCQINLLYPSVGATETCLFLAVLARGTSVIRNIALEHEITELISMLRSMGAIIFFESDRTLLIHGVKTLNGTSMYMIGDRIEAASWAVLACASNGRIQVSGVRPDLLGNFLSYYTMVGGGYNLSGPETIEFYRKAPKLSPVVIETEVHPGFATDWQQPFATLLTQAHGMSVIHETVHEQRFGYLDVLNKLGAKAQVVKGCLGSAPCRYKGHNYEHSALIHGFTELEAIDEPIKVPDLRAGLAYLIAAALAKGTTTLVSADKIERGYGNLIHKLRNVNLNLKRTTS